jgi:hypothetical protein
MDNLEQQDQYENQPPKGQFHDEPFSVMTFGEWLVTLLIMIVPILNFIMLIVWASDKNTNPNKGNWAKATLVIIGLQLILAMFFIGTIVGSLSTLVNQFSNTGMW